MAADLIPFGIYDNKLLQKYSLLHHNVKSRPSLLDISGAKPIWYQEGRVKVMARFHLPVFLEKFIH